MPTPRGRRFTLLDATTLVASTAVSLAVARTVRPEVEEYYSSTVFYHWLFLTVPLEVGWMLTVLGSRLADPRPRLRTLARRPGLVACGFAAIDLTWTLAVKGLALVIAPSKSRAGWGDLVMGLGRQVGAIVLVAWLTLALTGRWRPEPGWHDRAGFRLGAYFVAAFWLLPLVVSFTY